jgi:CBS domain containing-hemolysin-like protein
MHIDEVNETLDIELPEDSDYDTIGGYIVSHLGRIPVTGESFSADNVRFVILDAEARRVNRVQVKVDRRAGDGVPEAPA